MAETRAEKRLSVLLREAERWADECDDNAHWARTPSDRTVYENRSRILRGLLDALSTHPSEPDPSG